MKVLTSSVVYIDIMLGNRFYTQLEYEYCPLWPIEEKEVETFIESRCPSLKGREYNISFSNQKV